MNANRDTQAIREAMYQLKVNQRELAERLERLKGKPYKRGQASVSKQLEKKRLSQQMAMLYWAALEEGSSANPSPSPSTGDDLADAMRLLTRCNPAQLAKAIGYLTHLLEVPPQRR